MIDDELVFKHRQRALSPEHPVIRGTAQNPDVFFQARETVNPYYNECPGIVQEAMDKFAKQVGRQYKLFDYVGDPDADRVIVIMGSGAEACHATVEKMVENGEKVGLIKVRLYRPFSHEHLISALPGNVKVIAALDRTKEPGSGGEPLYLDIVNAVFENQDKLSGMPRIIGGRYGLSSKEFTPAMIKGVFDEMKKDAPKNHFTVGINDDVCHTSIEYDESYIIESEKGSCSIFYGLGADGTVSANKSSIKIIGGNTDNNAQGYFVYDSKKSGSMTVSHLRFGPETIRSTYLISEADFVGCHQGVFLEKIDVLAKIKEGGIFLLNSPHNKDEVWDQIPKPVQETIIAKKVQFYVIDAYQVARDTGMGGRINTIMQTCFFAISGVLPKDEAIDQIKASIQKTYGKKGEEVVKKNFEAVDRTLENLHQVDVPAEATGTIERRDAVPGGAPEFVRNVTAKIIAGQGDSLPVSAMPCDGTFPVGTTKWEKRNISLEIPVWDPDTCIQCGKCILVCPHAVIRSKVYDEKLLGNAPETFKSATPRDKSFENKKFTIQCAPEDCTGCAVCVEVCPAKNKQETKLRAINMQPQPPLRKQEKKNWEFFLNLPEVDRGKVKQNSVRGAQYLQPLFEFSGACGGCGETPYVKLMTQLFGDRMLIANATGCSSIYGGNLPTAPWATTKDGRGPSWSNSLFEDNAEFGFGFRLAVDKQREFAAELVEKLASQIGPDLASAILKADQTEEPGIFEQRERVVALKDKLKSIDSSDAGQLATIADLLVKKSVWILGGDGWAYDIGYGGLDHVFAVGRNVNILVLDTEVYSNTGGQASKATPRSAVAKFAAAGKPVAKKDLARMAIAYGNVYVANVAMGARDEQTVKAFIEAERYEGTSLIIAYSHCIAHGINMKTGFQDQKLAVNSGYWPLFRFNPELAEEGKNPLTLDSKAPEIPFQDFAYRQNRFKILTKTHPEQARKLAALAQKDVEARWAFYEKMAAE